MSDFPNPGELTPGPAPSDDNAVEYMSEMFEEAASFNPEYTLEGARVR